MGTKADPWWGPDPEIRGDSGYAGLSEEECLRMTSCAAALGRGAEVASRQTSGTGWEKALLGAHAQAAECRAMLLRSSSTLSGAGDEDEPSPLDWFRPLRGGRTYRHHRHCEAQVVSLDTIAAIPAFACDVAASQKRIDRLAEAQADAPPPPPKRPATASRSSQPPPKRRTQVPPASLVPPAPARVVDASLSVRALPLDVSVPLSHRGSMPVAQQSMYVQPTGLGAGAALDVDSFGSVHAVRADAVAAAAPPVAAAPKAPRVAEGRYPQEPTVLCPVRVETGCSLSYGRTEVSKLKAHLVSVHKMDAERIPDLVRKSLAERVECAECKFVEVSDTPASCLYTHLRVVHKVAASTAKSRAEKLWKGLGRFQSKR